MKIEGKWVGIKNRIRDFFTAIPRALEIQSFNVQPGKGQTTQDACWMVRVCFGHSQRRGRAPSQFAPFSEMQECGRFQNIKQNKYEYISNLSRQVFAIRRGNAAIQIL